MCSRPGTAARPTRPPALTNSIAEARVYIAHQKKVLREWGESVEDHPNDLPPTHFSRNPPDNVRPAPAPPPDDVPPAPPPNHGRSRWSGAAGLAIVGAVLLAVAFFLRGEELWPWGRNAEQGAGATTETVTVAPTSTDTPELLTATPTPTPDPPQALIDAGNYAEAVAMLEPRAREGDTTAALLLGDIVETAAAPRDVRFQAADVLTAVGDPRPGVATLPPAMVEIAGGTFVIGKSEEEVGDDDEINDQPVTVETFELARYPLTNAQYKLFIDDDGYNPERSWWDEAGRAWLQRDDEATEGLTDWQKRDHKHHPEWWNHEQFGIARPNYPVVGISWYEAVAFCRWLTQHQDYNPEGYVYRLPTEAEWEYAARRDTRRTYPWGNEEPDGERANYGQNPEGTTAVGLFPRGATPDGLQDMAGNAWEWTGSIFKPYPYDPTDGRENTNNPAGRTLVLLGGGWYYQSIYLRASNRGNNSPDIRNLALGFRPARHLPPNVCSVSWDSVSCVPES